MPIRKGDVVNFTNDELLALIPQEKMDALPEKFKENAKRFKAEFSHVDSLPASQLTPEEVSTIFNLKIQKEREVFMPYDVPSDLVSMLERWRVAFGVDQVSNEAVARVRINVFLLETVLAERAEMLQMLTIQSDPLLKVEMKSFKRDANLYVETPFKLRVLYEGISRDLTGKADYSVGYRQGESSSGNLICVEAKRRGLWISAHEQVLSYMAIVHHARRPEGKDNVVVFGLVTDSYDFHFLRINNDSQVTISPTLSWDVPLLRGTIYSLLRTTIRAAVLSSPTTSPVKGEGTKSMFQGESSSQYDFGAAAQFKSMFVCKDDSHGSDKDVLEP